MARGSSYFGVYRVERGQWIAKAITGGEEIAIGTFDSEKDAAVAYDKWASFNKGWNTGETNER